MRVGPLAKLLTTTTDWELLYTVETSKSGVVYLSLVLPASTATTISVAQVKAGNSGNVARSTSDTIYVQAHSNIETAVIPLGVNSLDDIYVKTTVSGNLIASANSRGELLQITPQGS